MSPALLITLLNVLPGQAEPKPTESNSEFEKIQIKRWQEYYKKTASEYEIFLDEDRRNLLTFRSKKIFQYSNPVRTGAQHGSIHVWTKDNRPRVVGSIWSSVNREDLTKRNIAHEFHSLAEEPVTALRGNKTVWETKKTGLRFKPIPDAKAPLKSKSLRFSQLRRLARDFTAKVIKNKSENERTLRLLPQPLYRYQSESTGVLEGGLFTFVMGTDPELFLLIEARKTNGGPQWHFTAVRFTYVPMSLRHRDVEVWSCENSRPYAFKSGYPYFLHWGMDKRDAVIGE